MPTSLTRRLLVSIAAASRAALFIAAITLGLVIAAKDTHIVSATFTPAYTVTLGSTASNAAADTTIQLNIASGDYNFSAVIGATPGSAFIAPSPGGAGYSAATHPSLGDIAGTLTSNTNLGLANSPCNTNLAVPFTFLYATVDNSGANEIPAIPQDDTGPLGTLENMATDTGNAPGADPPHNTNTYAPANGLPASVERYPAYLNDLFNNVQPIQRIVGNTVVAGTQVSLNIVTFAPGALKAGFAAPNPFDDFDASMGYISVSVLQDTTVPGAPSSITDFCSALDTTTNYYGTTETNECNGVTTAPCNTAGGISAPTSAGDDTGRQRYRNPSAGTQVWYGFLQSLRDLDGDGYENSFDTCPAATNTDGDPRTTNGPDADMLDSVCDPFPLATSANEDGDSAAGRNWLNAGDNCPRFGNNDQDDTDGLITTADSVKAPRGGPAGDAIGDDCDTYTADSLNTSDGRFTTVLRENAICIGSTDGDSDGWCATHGINANLNDPNDSDPLVTPEHYARVVKLEIAHSGSGVNPLVGGTNTALIGLGVIPHGEKSYQPSFSEDGAGPNTCNDGLQNGADIGFDGADPDCHDANLGIVVNTGTFSFAGMGEPYQACNDGLDNDGDTVRDLLDPGCTPTGLPVHPGFPACPVLGCSLDSDGDGFTDEAELHIGTDALGRCEVGNTPNISTDWPNDLSSGALPNSVDRINILDLASFVAPHYHLLTKPGDPAYDQRWDLQPGPGALPPNWINVIDMAFMTAPGSPSGAPPMFSGVRAFIGPPCTAHPTLQD